MPALTAEQKKLEEQLTGKGVTDNNGMILRASVLNNLYEHNESGVARIVDDLKNKFRNEFGTKLGNAVALSDGVAVKADSKAIAAVKNHIRTCIEKGLITTETEGQTHLAWLINHHIKPGLNRLGENGLTLPPEQLDAYIAQIHTDIDKASTTWIKENIQYAKSPTSAPVAESKVNLEAAEAPERVIIRYMTGLEKKTQPEEKVLSALLTGCMDFLEYKASDSYKQGRMMVLKEDLAELCNNNSLSAKQKSDEIISRLKDIYKGAYADSIERLSKEKGGILKSFAQGRTERSDFLKSIERILKVSDVDIQSLKPNEVSQRLDKLRKECKENKTDIETIDHIQNTIQNNPKLAYETIRKAREDQKENLSVMLFRELGRLLTFCSAKDSTARKSSDSKNEATDKLEHQSPKLGHK
jgi:hypothetical protein